ncbi:MAG: CDP-glycerol glycerophosphotransferase family protein [Actinomycetota bacterium]|nr:CDP-glycerol glycerophosphotransferase family protein [Actinomycetota bacterium]
MSARISVVVPLYNVAAYLETCLESLVQQTLAGLEVVMVDDGSTDESAEIAERFVARDSRFRLVRQRNAGLGAARNTGIEHAAGEFLAFVDSDDVVPRHAYEILVAALDETGSDFASGNVRRLTSFGTTQARFLAKAFERTRLRTHVTRFPALLADRTAWNKLFRRSFWDQHRLRFPEGVLYEDAPVTLPAHYLARSVDVVDQTVYLWRVRGGSDLSITQRRTEAKALRDRVASVDAVSRFLAEQGLETEKARYDRSVVADDLGYFLAVLDSADEGYCRLFLDLVNDFLDRADGDVLDQPLAIERLKWHLVRRRALPELLEVLRFEDEELGRVPPVRGLRHWYGDYPYRTDRRLRVPQRVYRLRDELALVWNLNDVRWEGERLRIDGYAYIEMIGAGRADAQTVDVLVRRAGSRRRPLRLRARPVHRPDVTAGAGQELADLDWSGFSATIDGDLISGGGAWREGSWEIGILVRAAGVRRAGWHPAPAPLHPLPVARLPLAGGGYARAGLAPGGELAVRVARRRAVARSYSLEGAVLQLEGDPGPLVGRDVTLRVERRDGIAALHYPVHVDRSGGRPAFLARVPVVDLLGEVDVADRAAHSEYEGDGVAWDVSLAAGGSRVRLVLDEDVPEAAWTVDGREVGIHRTRHDNLTIVERSFRPVLTDVEWSPRGTLLLAGSFRGPRGSYDLVLALRRGVESYDVPLGYDPEAARFTAELTPAAAPSLAGAGPLPEGLWDVLVRPRGASREAAVQVVLDRGLLASLPVATRIGHKGFRFGVLGYRTPVLAVDRDLDDDERGGVAQRRLRTSFYPRRRAAELRDAVLYLSFGGAEYSGSPRAIHEELVRRDAPLEHLWVVRDGAFEVPDTAVPVRELSQDYYEGLARARYVVANDHWPRWFTRRADQTCIQTLCGPPLKRQGYDLADRPRAVREYRRTLGQRSDNWQYVLSPAPFATPILERAFPVGGEVVETGLPRTDRLVASTRDVVEEARQRLSLPPGKRIVLYMPTYRDHLATSRGGYRLGSLLDLAAMDSAVAEDHVLLFRKHPRVVEPLPAGAPALVRDVSGFPDAVELLLVADVLVTDYSSWLFDFASTGRPILFFTPDLEAYRDEIRGFSIDLERDAPGPLLTTTADVIDALGDVNGVAAAYASRYAAFLATYCPLQDGKASRRVSEWIFGL